jgi:hypothetical protein
MASLTGLEALEPVGWAEQGRLALPRYPLPAVQPGAAALPGNLAAAREEELQWRSRWQQQQAGGVALTDVQTEARRLAGIIMRNAGELSEEEARGLVDSCGPLAPQLLQRSQLKKLAGRGQREQGRLAKPTRKFPEVGMGAAAAGGSPGPAVPEAGGEYVKNRKGKGKGKRAGNR